MTDRVRVAVMNDYEIVAAGVAAVLSGFSDRIDVVELGSRTPVISAVDVVLNDSFAAPHGENVDVRRVLAGNDARLVVFSWNTSAEQVTGALRAGADGYVSKGVSAEELVDLIVRISRGELVTPSGADATDGDRFGRWPGQGEGVSARESEVLALICQGHDNVTIAGELFIGLNTPKTHIRTLYRKIGVERRSQAVLWGVDHGFRPDRVRHR